MRYCSLEVANPLRSKRGKQKQIAFYFPISNLPAVFNSQFCHRHTFACFGRIFSFVKDGVLIQRSLAASPCILINVLDDLPSILVYVFNRFLVDGHLQS